MRWVRRSQGQELQSFASWVGDTGADSSLSFRYLWARWHSAGCSHVFQAPSVRESSAPLFLSVILLFPVCLIFGVLSLIQYPLSYMSLPPLHYICIFPFVMWKELRSGPIWVLFVICDCGAFGLSTKQFHKKLCLLIQFSKSTNACGEYYPLFSWDSEHVCGCACIYMQRSLCFYFIFHTHV